MLCCAPLGISIPHWAGAYPQGGTIQPNMDDEAARLDNITSITKMQLRSVLSNTMVTLILCGPCADTRKACAQSSEAKHNMG